MIINIGVTFDAKSVKKICVIPSKTISMKTVKKEVKPRMRMARSDWKNLCNEALVNGKEERNKRKLEVATRKLEIANSQPKTVK